MYNSRSIEMRFLIFVSYLKVHRMKNMACTECTGVLISPQPDQEGNKLMFLSEWPEFPSAPCLAGGKKLDDSSRLDVVEIARVPDMLQSFVSFLVGLRTCQHTGRKKDGGLSQNAIPAFCTLQRETKQTNQNYRTSEQEPTPRHAGILTIQYAVLTYQWRKAMPAELQNFLKAITVLQSI